MNRFRTAENIVDVFLSKGFETYHKQDNSFYLRKDIPTDVAEHDVESEMDVVITKLRNGVSTEIKFPQIRLRDGRLIEKRVSYDYEETPEGLRLHSYDSEDRVHKMLSGTFVLLEEV